MEQPGASRVAGSSVAGDEGRPVHHASTGEELARDDRRVMPLGFGLSGGIDLSARAATDLVVDAVDAGFTPAFVTEVSGAAATVTAAAVAAHRPGHELGTAILPLGSRTEATLAMEATSVAALAAAPFRLGVGVSSAQIVEGWHQARRDPTLEGTRTALRSLRALLGGQRRGSFGLRGTAGVEVRLLLGALGPRMVDLACTEADGVILNVTPADALPDRPEGVEVHAFVWVRACPDADHRARREVTSYSMAAPYARQFTALGYGAMVREIHRLAAEGRLRDAPDSVPQELLDRLCVDHSALGPRTAAYAAAGVTPIVMPVTGSDPAGEIRGLIRQLRAPGPG